MKQELKSGIPEFDNAVEQFENGEINFLELTCRLWNTAYAMGKSEQLILPLVSNNEVAVCPCDKLPKGCLVVKNEALLSKPQWGQTDC